MPQTLRRFLQAVREFEWFVQHHQDTVNWIGFTQRLMGRDGRILGIAI